MKNSKEYLDKISKIIEKPYINEFELYGINILSERKYILKMVYGEDKGVDGGIKQILIFDSMDNTLYYEDSYGYWVKREYDSKGNQIYWENSSGYFERYEYDSNGK